MGSVLANALRDINGGLEGDSNQEGNTEMRTLKEAIEDTKIAQAEMKQTIEETKEALKEGQEGSRRQEQILAQILDMVQHLRSSKGAEP
jgi:septal ring factor EnvC (AmiA/AmiB activator)